MEASQILQGIVWGVVLASTLGFSLAYGIHLYEESQLWQTHLKNIKNKGDK